MYRLFLTVSGLAFLTIFPAQAVKLTLKNERSIPVTAQITVGKGVMEQQISAGQTYGVDIPRSHKVYDVFGAAGKFDLGCKLKKLDAGKLSQTIVFSTIKKVGIEQTKCETR